MLEKMNISEKKVMILGLGGVCLYGVSILIKRNFLNIGLGLIVLASLLLVKKINLKSLDRIQKGFLILIILTPIFDLFSQGGLHSSLISIQKSYRFLPLFLAPIFLKNLKDIKKFMIAINFSVLINCFYVLNVYRKLNWNFNIRYETLPGIQDTSHCLVSLSYIVLALVFLAYKKKEKFLLVLTSFTYIFALFIIFISKTRGAWLALIFSMLVYLIILFNKRILIALSICSLLLGTGIILNKDKVNNNIYYQRIVSIKNTKAASPRIRLMLWEAAFNIWKEYPIFGVGKDNSPKFYLEYFNKNKEYVEKNLPEKSSQESLMEIAKAGNTHSMYFDNLLNMGLFFFYWLGLMFYIFIIQLKEIIKLKLKNKYNETFFIMLSSLGMTIAYAITGSLGSAWGAFLLRHVFLMNLILYISIKNLEEGRNRNE